MDRSVVIAVIALGTTAVAARGAKPARADPVAVEIRWASTDGCAGAGALRDRVDRRARRNTVVASGGQVIIDGRSGRRGQAWVASLSVTAAGGAPLGSRELSREGTDCSGLDEALVLVLAMITDASVPPESAARSGPAPQQRDAESPFAPRPALAPPPPGWRGALGAVAMTELGRLPGAAAGVEVSLSIEPPRLAPIEISAARFTETSAEVADGGAAFRHASGALLVCPLRLGQLSACAGGQLGVIEGRGFGFVDNRRERELVADARLELRAAVALRSRWFLRGGLGAWIPLIRPRFSFESASGEVRELFAPAPIAGIVHFGVGARFR